MGNKCLVDNISRVNDKAHTTLIIPYSGIATTIPNKKEQNKF
jgi:hypothetical protein